MHLKVERGVAWLDERACFSFKGNQQSTCKQFEETSPGYTWPSNCSLGVRGGVHLPEDVGSDALYYQPIPKVPGTSV